MEIALAFLAGLLIGSFLNVCIFRLPRDLSVVAPRSFCPGCVGDAEERGLEYEQAAAAGQLAWYDLIPVVSYVVLGGRCRRCKTRIPIRYPLVELATGAAFAGCVAVFGLHPVALKYAAYSAILITLIASDIEERILPDEFTLGGTALGLILAWFVPMPIELGHLLFGYWLPAWALSFAESALGAAVASGMIWFVGWIYSKIRHREGLGFGDVKMIAMIGAFIGLSSALVTIMVGSVLGTAIGLPIAFLRAVHRYRRVQKRLRRESNGGFSKVRKASATALVIALTRRDPYPLPFGSFLGIAALGVAAYGEIVFKWSAVAGN